MKTFLLSLYMTLLTLILAGYAKADQCTGNGTCMSPEDMHTFLTLLREQKCRNETPPKFTLDPVIVVVDKEGRIYGSGSDPIPYRLHEEWCNYVVDGTGTIKMVAAQHVNPDWGFRFRPKFVAGLLPFEVSPRGSWGQSVDVGVAADLAYWKTLNFNVHLGIRSFGTGVGLDLTKNFGIYAGYANTWGDWKSSALTGVYFGF